MGAGVVVNIPREQQVCLLLGSTTFGHLIKIIAIEKLLSIISFLAAAGLSMAFLCDDVTEVRHPHGIPQCKGNFSLRPLLYH